MAIVAALEPFTRVTMMHAAWIAAGAMVVTNCCFAERARQPRHLAVRDRIGPADRASDGDIRPRRVNGHAYVERAEPVQSTADAGGRFIC